MRLKIGLIEDSRFEFHKWELLADLSDHSCEVIWYKEPQTFLRRVNKDKVDFLVVDRSLYSKGKKIDIVTSGFMHKIREVYPGPIVYCSDIAAFKDEKHFFQKSIPGKVIKSIDKLINDLELSDAKYN